MEEEITKTQLQVIHLIQWIMRQFKITSRMVSFGYKHK